jgi:hypothetical protein
MIRPRGQYPKIIVQQPAGLLQKLERSLLFLIVAQLARQLHKRKLLATVILGVLQEE